MPKLSSIFICQQCGYQSPNFLGKCPECGTWNSLVEEVNQPSSTSAFRHQPSAKPAAAISLQDVEQQSFDRLSTGIIEFDRVLGGGIVKGSVILVSGDPGIGKSTLLSQLAINLHKMATPRQGEARNNDGDVLYVAGEESAQQIKLRIDRIISNANFIILNETDVDIISGVMDNLKPQLVIIDSIQTLETTDLTASPGSISQVKESAHRLQKIAKALHIPIFLVGHITKDGTIAGPKTLEHLVDVVIQLEGDQTSNFRILRASKNRFGPTDEIGIFEMEETGLVEVKNPSSAFINEKVDAPGSVIVATLNGLRPLLIEIQALAVKTVLPIPRRVGTGIDSNRLNVLTAVLAKRLNLALFQYDIFVNATGGLRLTEPAIDLAICLSIISSLKDKIIKPETVVFGEVGLLGEIRSIKGESKRVTEAKRLGFKNIVSPTSSKNLLQALKACDIV